jgi:uncharacterized protein
MARFKFYAIKTCGIIIVVFMLQLLIPGFTELFLLTESSMFGGEVWRFVTAIFLHGGIAHLVLNLFALALFGSILEKFIGGKKYLMIFFISGVLANFVAVIFYPSSLGASGAIFGVIGALVMIRPLLPIWAFGLPMPMFVAGILWAGIDILGTIGFLAGNPINNTGNIAHLSGMFFGFLIGSRYRIKVGKRRNPKIRFDEKSIRRWEDNYLR